MTGIHSHNQAPELKDYNVYTSDPVLRRAVERGGLPDQFAFRRADDRLSGQRIAERLEQHVVAAALRLAGTALDRDQ